MLKFATVFLLLSFSVNAQVFRLVHGSGAQSEPLAGAYIAETGDYITVADNDSLEFTGDFSVMCWVKGEFVNSGSGLNAILSKGRVETTGSYGIYILGNAFRFSPSSGGNEINTVYDVYNEYQHVAMTRSGSSVTAYVDGVQVGTTTNSGSAGVNADPLTFCIDQNFATRLFQGGIADVRLYSEALTSNEVFSVYDTGATIPKTLVGLYEFDGNANDTSGNANNGTLTGGTISSDPCDLPYDYITKSYSVDCNYGLQAEYLFATDGTDTKGTKDLTLFNGASVTAGILSLDGVNDYAEITHGTTTNQIVSAFPFSVAVWENGTTGSQFLFADTTSATIQFGATRSGSILFRNKTRNAGINYEEPTSSSYPTGSWYHTVYIWRNATFRQIYVNGVLDFNGQNVGSVTFPTTHNRLSIGRFGDSTPSTYFNGDIDSVQVYNTLLNATEVLDLYNLGR